MNGRRRLARIFLSAFGLLLALIILELFSRVYALRSSNDIQTAFSAPEDYWNKYDPVLGWRHIPGKTVERAYNEIPVSINKQGVRARKEYDANKKKILAVGCSVTFGHGVAAEDAWPQKLEDKLRSGGFDYDVVNLGACAYGLDQQYLWFLEKRAQFRHDIVILGLASTLDRVLMYRWTTGQGKPRFKVFMNKLILTNVPVPSRIASGKKYRDWRRVFFDFRKSYFLDLITQKLNPAAPEEKLQITEKILQAFSEKCKEDNSRFLVVLIYPEKDAVRILEKNKIDFIDCSGRLAGEKGAFIERDGHPSAYGHELISGEVRRFLLENKILN